MRGAIVAFWLLTTSAAIAQQVVEDDVFTLTPELDPDAVEVDELGDVEEVEQPDAAAAPGAVLRGLDKVSGILTDLELANGTAADYGRLHIVLGECRVPADNPTGDAYAFLEIREGVENEPVFQGWMIASSPALNALDHARYDVWVLRCMSS